MRYTVYAPISLWLDSLPEITPFEVSNLGFPPVAVSGRFGWTNRVHVGSRASFWLMFSPQRGKVQMTTIMPTIR